MVPSSCLAVEPRPALSHGWRSPLNTDTPPQSLHEGMYQPAFTECSVMPAPGAWAPTLAALGDLSQLTMEDMHAHGTAGVSPTLSPSVALDNLRTLEQLRKQEEAHLQDLLSLQQLLLASNSQILNHRIPAAEPPCHRFQQGQAQRATVFPSELYNPGMCATATVPHSTPDVKGPGTGYFTPKTGRMRKSVGGKRGKRAPLSPQGLPCGPLLPSMDCSYFPTSGGTLASAISNCSSLSSADHLPDDWIY